MKHIIIGTAGHIDHGKTALIQALTGRNTDRLPEEQRRGITIDLGFTWLDLPGGIRCGIVDVPGHEKFIAHMAAGAAGMDLVLVVIAANEGIMPQTQEHLDILDLLGVRKAVLVLTKCDLAARVSLYASGTGRDGPDKLHVPGDSSCTSDALGGGAVVTGEEWLVEAEIREGLRGTILEHAPAVRVSAATGAGIPALKQLLARMVREEVPARDVRGVPRLHVDRVFSLPGFGTIATGTLLSGTLSKGGTLEAYPLGKLCKIRNIQVHQQVRAQCEAGERAALNLSGVHKTDLCRGCTLAPPGTLLPSDRIGVRLRVLASARRIVRNRERLHLYAGTREVLCRAVLLDREDLGPGEAGLAQLVLEAPLAVRRGDRFVVRFYSPVETIGGGQVLEANPRKRKRADAVRELRLKEAGSLRDVVEACVRDAWDAMISLSALARAADCQELDPCLETLSQEGVIEVYRLSREAYCWHRDAAYQARQAIAAALEQFHRQHPYQHGIPRDILRHRFLRRVPPAVSGAVLDRMVRDGHFRVPERFQPQEPLGGQEPSHAEYRLLSLADYQIPQDGTFRAVETLLTDAFQTAGWHFLRFNEIDRREYPEETVRDILSLLIEGGRCVQIGETVPLYTLRRFAEELERRVNGYFQTADVITISQIRELCGTSRKCAKSMTEYLDGRKITKKTGAETQRTAYR